MEQWLGDQYDVQGIDSLSGLILNFKAYRYIDVGARGEAVGARRTPNKFENGL